MAKVSVLIAVHNAEPFLTECLDSLKRQSLGDFQAVCVDDASTDGSLRLLHERARDDSRFEVIGLKQNQGQAHARNVGLDRATGQYVCFLDADDWLEPDALQRCVEVMERNDDTDCVLFTLLMEYANRSALYPMPSFSRLSGRDAFRMSLTWKIHGVYMVRAGIHRQYPYDETCKAYADDNTTRLHYLSSRWVGLSAGVYHYRQHASSVTHAVSVRRYDYLRANESMRQSLIRLGVEADVLAEYENHRWLNLVGVYMFHHVHARELMPAERRYGLNELRRVWHTIDRSLLSPATARKFGYRPMLSWPLFRLQEWLYFTLRGLLGKNS